VAIEPMTSSEGADADDRRADERLRELARLAFERWEAILAAALRREGVSAVRARRLGALTVASIEGTVAMCRAARNAQPLDDVQRELEAILTEAVRR
jgi:hypothetical protein